MSTHASDRIADLRAPSARSRIVATIRSLHAASGGLSRVHRTHPDLYARARRAFGSWRAAVEACGLDYRGEVARNLREGLRRRDERRALARPSAAPGDDR